MPNFGEKNVLVNGMVTLPPLASASNSRSASASDFTVIGNPKPWNTGLPSQRPSEARIVLSPSLKLACMILFSEPGGSIPGGGGSGLSLLRMSSTFVAPSAVR